VFTWRNAFFGALGMFTFLGFSVFAYFVMWSAGIGPLGNLQAQGVITEGEPVLLADFQNRTDQADLGSVLTGALRTDLEQSTAISIVSGAVLREALVRMGRDPSQPLVPEIAYEVAVREGIAAVIEGEVGTLGPSYVITARVVTGDGADVVASFRKTAAGEDELVDALERLSREIRGRVGESLLSINQMPALAQVTTASLEALRIYTEGQRLYDLGERSRAIGLMEQAVALDTAFAMGHRKLSAWYYNLGRSADMKKAAGKAVAFAKRLPRVERDLATAWYQSEVTEDGDGAMRTYRDILDYAPNSGTAANNLAWLLMGRRRYAEAAEVLEASVERGVAGRMGYLNLFRTRIATGDTDRARRTLESQVEVRGLPSHTTFSSYAGLAARIGAVEEAHAWADSMEARGDRIGADYYRWGSDFRVGRLEEAARHMQERADLQARDGNTLGANWTRTARALSVLQADTAGALTLLGHLAADADRLGPDSVFYDNLAWAHWQARSIEGVRRLARMAQSHAGETDDLEAHARYIRLLEVVVNGEYDLTAFEAVEKDCVGCQRQERAELAYSAGRLDEAASHYEEIFRIPGQSDFGDLWAPLYHERVAAIYEELGNKAKAAEHCAAFADMWADADAEVQPRVRRARAKAELLSAPSGGLVSD